MSTTSDDAARHARLTALFAAARKLPAAERDAFVARECGDDARLREELLALLGAGAGAGKRPRDTVALRAGIRAAADEVLEGREGEADDVHEPEIPERIGSYRVVGVLGEGGMGVVYEAEQENPRRAVAVKVLRASGAARRDLVRRFRREAELLGQLTHPCIAQVYEAGAFEGNLYIVMELVRGTHLLEHASLRRLDVRSRLRLFLDVCDAVSHAHARGIVHRDIKPANILVGEDGRPRVLDFGVARVVGSDLAVGTVQTATGQLIGTIAYMSPEQVAGDSSLVDARSDVHALGVLLMELLTGRRPHDLEQLSLPQAIATIRDQEPSRLSSMDLSLRGDLDTIVAKALEKSPERRYQSVAEMASDLRRHLRDEPIVARPPSATYQLAKFARRNRAIVAGFTIAFLALAVGTTVAVRQAVRATRASRQAESNAALASDREAAALQQLYRASIAAAQAAALDGDLVVAARRLQGAPETLRGWEWRLLRARLDEAMATIEVPGPMGVAPCFMPGDRIVVPIGEDGRPSRGGVLATFDLVTGAREDIAVTSASVVEAPAPCWTVAHCLVPLDGEGARVDVREAGTGRSLAQLVVPPRADFLQGISRDGAAGVAVVKETPDVEEPHVLSLRDGDPGPALRGKGNALSADGRRFTVLRDDAMTARIVDVHELPGWRLVQTVDDPGGGVSAIALDETGSRLATGARDGRIRLWDVATGHLVATSREAHDDRVTAFAFRADGLVASGSEDRTVALWSPDLALRRGRGTGHSAFIDAAAFSPAGDLLGTRDVRSVRVWDVDALLEDPRVLSASPLYVYGLAFSPDGSHLATVGWDGFSRIWNARTSELLAAVRLPADILHAVAWSPDGRLLAVTTHEASVALVDALTGELLATLSMPGDWITDTWFSEDSRLLRAAGRTSAEGGNVRRTWDVATRQVVADEDEPALASAAGGAAPSDRDLLFDPSGRERRFGPHEQRARTPDGRWHALATQDRGIIAWEEGALEPKRLHSPPEGTLAVAVSPEGTRLASGGHDRNVHVHDLATGEELLELTGHRDYVHVLAFSPDGSVLASGSGDGTVRLWDTRPLRERVVARRRSRELRTRVEPMVRAAFAELATPREVVQRLLADASLDDLSRAAALDVALGVAVRRAGSPGAEK